MKKIKKHMIICIIVMFVLSMAGAIAITYFPSSSTVYDNSDSGMTSTNVQDAIDELYNHCTSLSPSSPDDLKDTTVTEGDGLYEDEYENGRYIYKGANPNNYITFNDETSAWRIISIESDGSLKIIKNNSVANDLWGNGYTGDNKWNNNIAALDTLKDYYSEIPTDRSLVINHNWNVGKITDNNNDLASQIAAENSSTWSGQIGLASLSEYLRTNSNKSSCSTFSSYQTNYNNCKNTTWMYPASVPYNWWTITANGKDNIYVYSIDENGKISSGSTLSGSYTDAAQLDIRPVFYLSPNIKLSGSGAQTDPFIIN